MPKLSLTEKFVAGTKPGPRQTDYFDAKCPGLVFRVSPTGVKTWCLFFTSPKDGKRARSTLGRYPQTTLSDARTRATEAKAHADEGIDPRDVTMGAMTVAQLASSYFTKHVRPNLRSAKAVERRLGKNMLPVIGGLALRDLHKRDVNRVVDSIMARGCQVEAARVFQDMRALFRWAVARGDLDHNPMEGMRAPHAPKPRERVLSDEEVRTLWEGLPEALPRSKAVQRIIKLCLLTAQRVGEVSGMSRTELDLKAACWTIPAARSKNKRSHTVPLSQEPWSVIASGTYASTTCSPTTRGKHRSQGMSCRRRPSDWRKSASVLIIGQRTI